jgi:predicted Zn-dependent protease
MGVFALVWGSVVIVGQFEADKKQPTLMTVCWSSGSVEHAAYQDDLHEPLCTNPEKLVWAKKVKKVFWHMPSNYQVHRDGFERSLKYWNNSLDNVVFVETNVMQEADVVITPRPDSGKSATSHFKVDGEIRALIVIKPGLINIRRFMLVVQHELGHALGLAHDAGGSIMNRTLPEPDGMRVWLVTSKDKKALKKVMGL